MSSRLMETILMEARIRTTGEARMMAIEEIMIMIRTGIITEMRGARVGITDQSRTTVPRVAQTPGDLDRN
jgi:hypothetical protein